MENPAEKALRPAEIVKTYHRAIERGDWKALEHYLSDDFIFIGPTVKPLGKRALISSQKALWAAFPDVNFNLRIDEDKGNTIKATVRITGTHTNRLIPPFPDKFMVVEPTGKHISLEEEPAVYTIRHDKLIKQDVEPKANGGWPGIFKQLGLTYPYPE
jgi:hypothetical protein